MHPTQFWVNKVRLVICSNKCGQGTRPPTNECGPQFLQERRIMACTDVHFGQHLKQQKL